MVSAKAVVVGEVLFDQFQDGSSVLGGAPFNVAWHLQGFAAAPLLISRVGEDLLGEQVRSSCAKWQLPLAGLQSDSAKPTGRVEIALQQGQPSFSILPDQAYDHIALEPALRQISATTPAILYHGSLLARTPHSYQLLQSIRSHTDCPVFVDINLREPWWQRESALSLCQGVDWLKINDQEIYQLLDVKNQDEPLEEAAIRLQKQAKVANLLVTRGSEGAFVLNTEGLHYVSPAPVSEVVDTVGAGDAFSAVTLLGIMHGWPLGLLLDRASSFASRICAQRGATSSDLSLYQEYRERWGMA